MFFKAMIRKIVRTRREKGFYSPSSINEVAELLSKLMLMVTELSEAAEAVRRGDIDNFTEEMADTMIRIFDTCGTMNIDIKAAVLKKMKINKQRPYMHGKKI